jgi:hypothetical protein
MSQNDGISNTFAQRHYLDYSDQKISENMEWKRKDAALKWELNNIENIGPNWREHQEATENAVAGMSNTSNGGGGNSPSPASEIPEFGGGEATPETPAETPTETAPEAPAEAPATPAEAPATPA